MNKQFLILVVASVVLAACSAPQHQPNAPLDTRAVQEYNNRVYSGNTVPVSQRVKTPKQVETPVNQSDKQPRRSSVTRINPSIGVGVGYGWGSRCHHRHCW